MSEMQALLQKKTTFLVVALLAAAVVGQAAENEANTIQSKQAYVGATVEFDCELRNFYESEIQWRKLVGRMSDESEELSDGRLVIHQLTHEDAGEYECFNPDNGDKRRMRLVVLQANGNGASTQTQAHINPSTIRATHSKPTLQSKYEADVDTNTGESIEIFCEYTNEPNMKWRKVDGSLGAHAIIYGSPNNRLVLNSITEEDEGNYECVLPDGTTSTIYVHVMPGTLKKSNIQQNVFKTNTNDNTDDQLENIITVNAATGSTVKLECELSDYTPGGELSWTKLDGIISYNSRMVDNRLELEDVTADDAGIYECSSENLNTIKFQVIVNNSEVKSDDDAKSTKTTTATTATRTSSETTEQRNEDTYVTRNIGAQLEIVCALRVQAHDIISWARLDGREIDYSRASSHDNKLVFTSIRPEDAGIYECKSEATRNTHRTRITIMGETFVKEPNATVLQADRRQGQSSPRCQSWQFMCDTFQCIPRWKVCDGKQDCPDGSDEANCTESGRNRDHEGHLRQLQQPEHRQEETETWGCHETEATCRNGECIPKWKLCNGKADCSDGSDEHSCGGSTGIAGQCQPNERPCRTDGKCIPKIWWCDGERECADGSDEESCFGPMNGMCRSYEFMCKSSNQCVYKSFLCDGERDCADSSDEMGCIEPKVIQTPVREVRVCLGSTFQLECRATGFPVPYINWRLNWGHVCSEPRCCMHSDETGYGILTVTNAKYEDAGAYSCEAFSTKGREFAIPDAIVRVEHCYHQPEFECKPNPCYPCTTTTTTTTTTTRRTTTRRTTTTTPIEINEDCSCNGHSDMCTCSNVCYDCQHGTNGTHCESCLPGYTRDPSRPNDLKAWCYKDYIPPPFIRTTTRPPTTTTRYINIDCECYNHSECTCEGKCHRCLHHTKGEQCDECIIGYQGDPKHGTEFDCQPIPGFVCPGNTQGELDGCNECKPGYTGDPHTFNCFPIDGYNAGYQDRVREYHHYVAPTTTTSQPEEDYHPGYYHDSNQQYQHYEETTTTTTSEPEEEQYTDHNFDRFQPFLAATTRSQAVNAECNMFGTSQLLDGTCKCKAGVIGATCDQCAPRFFHLVERKTYKKGCVSCFCNGLEVDCASSNLRYSKLTAKFDEDEMWKISDRFMQIQHELEIVDNGIEFKRFDEFNDVEMFFLVPAKFKGQKLNAYGGRLEFNLTVRDQSSPGELKQVEIRLSGAHVNIVHKSETAIEVNRETPISLQLVEDNFKRYGDNGRVDRDHLMMALSEIKIIMIRASYTQKQESIRLSDFTLDIAVENDENDDEKNDDEEKSVPAKMVEVCQCPIGYTGNSCENCAEGYVRSRRGFYLGLCEPQL